MYTMKSLVAFFFIYSSRDFSIVIIFLKVLLIYQSKFQMLFKIYCSILCNVAPIDGWLLVDCWSSWRLINDSFYFFYFYNKLFPWLSTHVRLRRVLCWTIFPHTTRTFVLCTMNYFSLKYDFLTLKGELYKLFF